MDKQIISVPFNGMLDVTTAVVTNLWNQGLVLLEDSMSRDWIEGDGFRMI